jgi:hypothetical protein
MKKFIVLDENSNIVNIIVSNSKKEAEAITGNKCIAIDDGKDIGIDGWWDGKEVKPYSSRLPEETV